LINAAEKKHCLARINISLSVSKLIVIFEKKERNTHKQTDTQTNKQANKERKKERK
jgi:hypothetical protein